MSYGLHTLMADIWILWRTEKKVCSSDDDDSKLRLLLTYGWGCTQMVVVG